VLLERAASCQFLLGRPNEGSAALEDLAKVQNGLGNKFIAEGKPEAALEHYQKALAIQTRLIEKEGRKELAADLALSYDNLGGTLLIQGNQPASLAHYEKAIEMQTALVDNGRQSQLAEVLAESHESAGNVLFLQGKPDAAIVHYQAAVEIQTRLAETNGQNKLFEELATGHRNLGDSFLSQQKPRAAMEQYDKSMQILTRLVGRGGADEMRAELAVSQNNRGVAHRSQGELDAAIADFDVAIETLASLNENQRRSDQEKSYKNRRTLRRVQVSLDVAIGCSEKAIDILSRTRIPELSGGRTLSVMLATSLSNRAYARLVQAKPHLALEDFNRAREMYAKLVETDGQKDLAQQFARILSSMAWIHATNPDNSYRDGRKATEYALRACELSEYKTLTLVETLAAAYAEAGQFADAVKCQEMAMQLAGRKAPADLHLRLELYKSGNAYRAPLPKAN
jgi:tetratricopeptide (TPR) repeat protein